ncbi:UNVERIFIED_CONTAM: hypothetical protein GTU68_046783 [Idotea baltica]|nr:hypothetical protein [Idotea baltica]
MVATIHRDGHEYVQTYRRGKPTGPVKKVKPFRGHGTTIFFEPDDLIFRKTVFNSETIRQHLEDVSYIHGGLTIVFKDEHRARLASRDAVKEVKRKSASSRRTNLPGKLVDCQSKNADESEVFIVEGESAGGTAVMGRNSIHQAILPLKGKILNTESLPLSKVVKNQEISDLIETLGTGVGPNFDIHRLRYCRVILLMDADSDGYHISTLLLTFFFRHMPEMIRQGKLFIAQPPLFRIEVGKSIQYAQTDAEKEDILNALPENRKATVLRFKGLGEMNAAQLRDTTLNPEARVLLKVQIESQLEADQTFNQLLGKEASERYKIIMEDASFADDVDN